MNNLIQKISFLRPGRWLAHLIGIMTKLTRANEAERNEHQC